MAVPRLTDPSLSCLAVIDIQEKFGPAMPGFLGIATAAGKLVSGCVLAGTHVLATEQYPKGLGATVEVVKQALGDRAIMEKTSFSCAGVPEFMKALKSTGAKNTILCGVETHVCVCQTGLDLIEAGYNVFVVVDAVSSRRRTDHETALRRLEKSGAIPVTVESVLFELLGNARHPAFRQIQAIVK